MFHYKSYGDLARDIAAGLQRIPVVDLVVGIPKSGMIPATMLASFLNRKLLDLNSFEFSYGLRSGVRKYAKAEKQSPLRVLVVDDSVNTGTELRRVRERLSSMFGEEFSFTFLAVYGLEDTPPSGLADVILSVVPQPRVFQWNYRNHIIGEHALFDMDGVLCLDPSDEDNDDGPRYAAFLKAAEPLAIPQKKLSGIVTSRLERWRTETEAWLEANGVKYDELIMLDLPTAEERRRLRAHAPFKAEVYRARDEILFLESNWKQAQKIAELADKPVMCTENDILLYGKDHLETLRGSGFSLETESEAAQIKRWMQQIVNRLGQFDPEAETWLKQRGFDAVARPERPPNNWVKQRSIMRTLPRPDIPHGQVPMPLRKLRLALISTSFNVEFGAGAAASSQRLAKALEAQGHTVEQTSAVTQSEDDGRMTDMPVNGTKGAYWHSLHEPERSAELHARVNAFAPDCLILGAIDRRVMSVLDIALLPYPIVWVARDNWIHTGGCLFKLPPESIETRPDELDPEYESVLTCEGYKSECRNCPIINDPGEKVKAEIQYSLKEQVYSYRKDMVFAPISGWMAEMLRDAPLTRRHMIRTCTNPIDLDRVRSPKEDKATLRRRFGLPETGKVILLSAHSLSNPRKGTRLALSALRKHRKLSKVHVAVMGKKQVSGIEGAQISHLGFVSDEEQKLALFAAADVVAIPALQESLSVVASEALCSGTPVVAFQTSGLACLLEHRKTGYLARPFDVSDFARGLLWTLFEADQDALRRDCRAAAELRLDDRTNVGALIEAAGVAIEAYPKIGPLPPDIAAMVEMLGLFNRQNAFTFAQQRHLRKNTGGQESPRNTPKLDEMRETIKNLESKLRWNRKKRAEYEERFGKI